MYLLIYFLLPFPDCCVHIVCHSPETECVSYRTCIEGRAEVEGPLAVLILVQSLHVDEDLRLKDEDNKAALQDPLQDCLYLDDLRRSITCQIYKMTYNEY